ncbi:zinc-finger domain-containing protein [Microbaculum marinum]|uniref:Zinc-finger domain-containing protein n=1 Tax=Microbaculum marinum TaxID=1764581 RepID=A0AAW9S053_9HYPH
MADNIIPHFHNTGGYSSIRIGAREFQCIGALPPFDHPHVFLDLGDEDEIVCPYCSTHYKYDAGLTAGQAEPVDSVWRADAA